MAIRFEDGNLVHVVQYIQCPQDRQVVTDSDMGRALFDFDQGGAAHPGMVCQVDLAPPGSFPANNNPLAQLAKRVPHVDRVGWFNVCHSAQYCGLVRDKSNIMASAAQTKDDGLRLDWRKAGPARDGPDSPIAPDKNPATQQHSSTGKSGYPEERVQVKKSIRWLTLKRPGNLNAAEQKALAVVREAIPELANSTLSDYLKDICVRHDVQCKSLVI